MASAPIPKLSEEEYLRIERAAFEKSEYHDGEMFTMSGGTSTHALLISEIMWHIRRQLPPGCRLYSSDLRIKVADTANRVAYSYADCSLVCGELQLAGDAIEKDNQLNPCLIVEVLSPSSESYDRGKKFELYRAIESFREYLIVHQDRRKVEHYSKQDDGSWLLRKYSGAGATVTIRRWNMQIPLDELYASLPNLQD